jgi:hypothetical protein
MRFRFVIGVKCQKQRRNKIQHLEIHITNLTLTHAVISRSWWSTVYVKGTKYAVQTFVWYESKCLTQSRNRMQHLEIHITNLTLTPADIYRFWWSTVYVKGTKYAVQICDRCQMPKTKEKPDTESWNSHYKFDPNPCSYFPILMIDGLREGYQVCGSDIWYESNA